MDPMAVRQAAALLHRHRTDRRPFDGFPQDLRPMDEPAAYAVQAELHRLADGAGPVAGYKIGCTTPVMQAYLDIDHPCAGILEPHAIWDSPAALSHAAFHRVGVECELAVRLERSLPPGDGPHDRTAVAGAVGECRAAIEIVDDRYVDFRRLDAATLIADRFFHAGCVLGPPAEGWRDLDLPAVTGRMTIAGQDAGSGTGAAVMGHPFEAVAWLANHLNAHGAALKPGDLVMTGSIVETRWPKAGDMVEVTLAGIGAASVRFS
jgi:2-keto-4-pentenoate hydratase